MEKNRHILKKVIGELPLYSPGDNSFDKIDEFLDRDTPLEKNRHFLENAINILPQHHPGIDLFDKIVECLEERNKKEISQQLPSHEPSEDLWNKIESQLEKEKPRETPIRHLMYYSLRIAAVSILFIGIYSIYTYNQSFKEKIEYSYSIEKSAELDKVNSDNGQNENNLMEFINTTCMNQPDLCNKPQIGDLKTQLDDLENEKQSIKQNLEQDKNNPELEKSLIKIEKTKTKIAKKLMQYIIS